MKFLTNIKKYFHKKLIYWHLIGKGIDRSHALIMAEQFIFFKYSK